MRSHIGFFLTKSLLVPETVLKLVELDANCHVNHHLLHQVSLSNTNCLYHLQGFMFSKWNRIEFTFGDEYSFISVLLRVGNKEPSHGNDRHAMPSHRTAYSVKLKYCTILLGWLVGK